MESGLIWSQPAHFNVIGSHYKDHFTIQATFNRSPSMDTIYGQEKSTVRTRKEHTIYGQERCTLSMDKKGAH